MSSPLLRHPSPFCPATVESVPFLSRIPANSTLHAASGCRMQPPSVNHPKFFELSMSEYVHVPGTVVLVFVKTINCLTRDRCVRPCCVRVRACELQGVPPRNHHSCVRCNAPASWCRGICESQNVYRSRLGDSCHSMRPRSRAERSDTSTGEDMHAEL